MNPDSDSLAAAPDAEIVALIESLHRTGQRLEELTAGEVDTVADRDGHTFVLRRAQQQLREIEAAKQAAILNAVPAHLALLDVHGIIVSVNQAWRDFGPADEPHAPGHAVGVDYLAICDRGAAGDPKVEQVSNGIRAVLAGDAENFTTEYPCPSAAKERTFLMKVTCLAHGGPTGAVVMHVDISAQKESEESLRASEVRFRQMAESIRDVFFLADVDGGRLLYMSPAYEAITGRSCASLYGNPQAWFEAIHPDDRAAASEAWAHGMAVGREYEYESRFICADGSTRWMAVRGFPVRQRGRVVRMAGVAEDTTNRKRSKEELQRAHEHLVKASRQAGMAEVATNILHNVGNVLNSVNVSASLAMESVRNSRAQAMAKVVALLDEHRADVGRYITEDAQGRHIPALLGEFARDWMEQQRSLASELGSLRTNVDHIKRIVAVQQDYAKVFGAPELVDLCQLVDDSLRMNAGNLAGRVRIVREFADVAPISVEKHKLLQILVNLVSNAQHACAASGREGCRITLGIAESGGRVTLSVADSGAGIAAQDIVRIFAHGFTTRKDGHGFGLHSGSLAAAELGGTLRAHSDGPGKGATFTLDLPARRAEAADA